MSNNIVNVRNIKKTNIKITVNKFEKHVFNYVRGVKHMKALCTKSAFVCSNPLKLSLAQQNYLDSGTYEVTSMDGMKLLRKLQVIGIDPDTGYLLIMESYADHYPYKKLFVLSPEGKTEKHKGQMFQNIS